MPSFIMLPFVNLIQRTFSDLKSFHFTPTTVSRFWLREALSCVKSTGGTDHTGSYSVGSERPGPSHPLESPF